MLTSRTAVIRATTLGRRAHAALRASRNCARVLARLTDSAYLAAGDEIVWVGAEGSARHPRAVLTRDAVPRDVDDVHVDTATGRVWCPSPLRLTTAMAAALADGCRRLRATALSIGRPAGLGALLTGSGGDGPGVMCAAPHAIALAHACASDDADHAAAAARALLGLGEGLTPSGDDFVGGAFFARRLMANAGLADPVVWAGASAMVRATATGATHPLSATLLGDLLDGESHEALHDLAHALAARDATERATAAAARVTRLGQSSGWDMLAGFVLGVIGAP